ncbi:MAG: sugar O-acetyltransferase [Bacillota bacterium]|jgi:maltose O-acetyltransferase
MTQKEKMLQGKLYQAFDEELFRDRQSAKEMVFKFNSLPPGEIEVRNAIIKKLFGKVSGDFLIEPPFHCDYGYNITIGKNFYANNNCIILDCAPVTIGDNVLLGPNVGIFTAGHPIHFEVRNYGLEYALPIRIGNNVWLGGGVIVNPGVNIGDNVVIGSGSIVTKDIPANSLAVGNPCKVMRKITEKDKYI